MEYVLIGAQHLVSPQDGHLAGLAVALYPLDAQFEFAHPLLRDGPFHRQFLYHFAVAGYLTAQAMDIDQHHSGHYQEQPADN